MSAGRLLSSLCNKFCATWTEVAFAKRPFVESKAVPLGFSAKFNDHQPRLMILKRFIVFASLVFLFQHGYSQRIATLEADVSTLTEIHAVSVDLDRITFASDSSLNLVEVNAGKKVDVPFQVEYGNVRILHWFVKPGDGKIKKRVYELHSGKRKPATASVTAQKQDGGLVVSSSGKNLLRYQFETVYPPAGVDTAYRRSGFIHPLWSPRGQVLTRIQPPDHYHHYGIWNPWTHVLFEGDTIDFWNINGKQGTVRFAKFTSITSGPIFSEYAALHEHVAFKKRKTEKVALNEVQSVRVFYPANETYYVVDVTIEMNCASPSDVLLLTYRYGGFGWRTTEQWDNKNSTVLSSEGKTRKDADGTTARWCIVQGTVNKEQAGVVMMSYPTNYNHPEPLRIWPENQYGRGDMFANFSPTKNKDWLLKSGNVYQLKYRLLVFNGTMTKEKAEQAWQLYKSPVHITVKTN
jgi:hypothetical protein